MMIKKHETQRLTLRTLSTDEAELSLNFYKENDNFLRPYEPIRDASFYTLDHHRRIILAEEAEMEQRRMIRLWLFLKDDQDIAYPIGNFAFSNIVHGCFQSCFLGYKMDHRFLRNGYMSEALKKGIDLMFKDYGLHRIEANIMPSNIPSLQLTQSLGFVNEGISKDYLRINDRWEDHIHMVLLNSNI